MQIQENPASKDIQFLENQINAHNIRRTGHDDGRLLAIFPRDDEGHIIAGLYGWTWAGWLEVRFLWVHEDRRGTGLGKKLLQTAEQEARARGCTRVLLDSYTFQAPDFYRKLGYEIFGVLEGFPGEHKRVFLTKRLD
jgi:GNAT superfamily N-acetyltransferase